MAIELIWASDNIAEQVLTFLQIDWVVKVISITEIDWDRSAHNCARLHESLSTEKIEEYHSSMVRGDQFPMAVVELGDDGRYVILGGNQRLNAVKRFNEPVDISVYCVQPLTKAFQEAAIRSLNARHGWGDSRQDRIEHAVYLVRSHGLSVDDVSRLLCVGRTTINARIRSDEMKKKLVRFGLDPKRLTNSILDSLTQLDDDEHVCSLAKIAISNEVHGDAFLNAVHAVKRARSSPEKKRTIAEFAKEQSVLTRKTGTKATAKRPRRDKFLRMLKEFVEFLERGNDGTGFSNFSELQLDPVVDGDAVKVLSRKIVIRLQGITS